MNTLITWVSFLIGVTCNGIAVHGVSWNGGLCVRWEAILLFIVGFASLALSMEFNSRRGRARTEPPQESAAKQ